MKQIILLLFIIVANLFSSDIIIQKKRVQNSIEFYLYNPNEYHITLEYNANKYGVKSSINFPFVKTINPKTKEYLFTITPLKNSTYKFKSKYKWIMGDKNAKHDNNYIYRLPYKLGETKRVSQSFNGKFSHKGDSKYAIDFDMKVGEKVYAAREGEVVDLKFDSNKNGITSQYKSEANFITIKHTDNTYATYAHLKRNGVLVSIGDRIKRGEIIGYSGNTGYSTAPHLHFIVFKAKDGKHRESLKIKFKTVNNILSNPKEGSFYTAVN